MVLIYTTFPSKEECLKVCKQLLEERKIACFNVFQIQSGYWWQDRIVEDQEWAAILKTDRLKECEVFEALKKLHPYTTPAIISIEAKKADEQYLGWLVSTISAQQT
ncbi:MAG: CutA1 divalent ion tolerance protein [Thermotoga sp. 50_1627]|uniref:divalent-cation tolerance protein CutA n=1 Tax=Pseudothermotoga sp. TaxID=2033661 RepID=UPI00076CC62C|nr:MAG: CutA1 divalent ion tolerance protein [Thermotoga sp. 50_64]KUK25447.1 MAG: CutA1 divalent ion tolerance protein [Thermotoga sp. 50_1627]MBC7115722.1 divalent-cation tolerance protein CutA [Pseudothermotoga sp.]MDK2923430.1 periplasmic divalent cation tolerance protein [Pseudothermotoga sp.]HBT39014.1 divalent-cation tolerance protein CutA [Pseudothermotoga sp.]